MHAVEGYSESIAVTEAHFGVKVSIVQAAPEVTLITNSNHFAPSIKKYRTVGNDTRSLVENANAFPDQAFNDALLAVLTIAGEKNPPMRLIAGNDAMGIIRDRISSASEELEGFAY